ncbi:MAG TPA: HD domain-containing phosphohydrolase [Terriglobales bacterium]
MIRLSEVVSALSQALDLTEGQPMGHAIRSCILGMGIAEELRLPSQDCSDLYYALLLKDAGCTSNAARMYQILGSDDIRAKREVKLEDWTKVTLPGLCYAFRNTLPASSLWQRAARVIKLGIKQKQYNLDLISARCERGAEIARKVGLTENAARAIRSLDEHWDGGGYPEGLAGEQIPLLARIICVSQTLEVFASEFGPETAIEVVTERSASWFDPEIVRVVKSWENDDSLWQNVEAHDPRPYLLRMEPGAALPALPERIDCLCQAFAEVIDAKSPYTFNHSVGVADAATKIAERIGLAENTFTMVRRAALLHDIGKLSVSNAILEKPGKLTDAEWNIMKLHPVYTRAILKTISGFENLAFIAGAHHERLDGSGYPDGLGAQEMPLTARIIAVADVFHALSEKRPYREALAPETVFSMMEKEAPNKLDADCLAALKKSEISEKAEEETLAQSVGI